MFQDVWLSEKIIQILRRNVRNLAYKPSQMQRKLFLHLCRPSNYFHLNLDTLRNLQCFDSELTIVRFDWRPSMWYHNVIMLIYTSLWKCERWLRSNVRHLIFFGIVCVNKYFLKNLLIYEKLGHFIRVKFKKGRLEKFYGKKIVKYFNQSFSS